MVGMGVGVNHSIDGLHLRGNHLLAEIRAGVDDDGGFAAIRTDLLHHEGRARAPVPGVLRVAGTPIAVDARHAGRRRATENREAATVDCHTYTLVILEKQRKAFSVVISAICSKETPCTSARTSAVLTT